MVSCGFICSMLTHRVFKSIRVDINTSPMPARILVWFRFAGGFQPVEQAGPTRHGAPSSPAEKLPGVWRHQSFSQSQSPFGWPSLLILFGLSQSKARCAGVPSFSRVCWQTPVGGKSVTAVFNSLIIISVFSSRIQLIVKKAAGAFRERVGGADLSDLCLGARAVGSHMRLKWLSFWQWVTASAAHRSASRLLVQRSGVCLYRP